MCSLKFKFLSKITPKNLAEDEKSKGLPESISDAQSVGKGFWGEEKITQVDFLELRTSLLALNQLVILGSSEL